ncbi:MAG: glycosyltransferase family 4 protein [Candidatus Woesearchaeota archaeon]
MKIVVFSSYFLPHKGGVENYVHNTGKRLVKRGHKVWVVTSRLKGMKAEETIDGMKVLRFPAIEPLPGRMAVPFAVNALEKIGRPDVIVTHTRFYPLSVAGGMIAKSKGIPWLHVEHGTAQVSYANPLVDIGAKAFDATAGRWILRNAVVAGVSGASCAFAKRLGAKNCMVLYNGVDTRFFDGKKKKHKDIQIVYVGRLIREKGVQDLLKAVRGMPVNVVIIGKGPYESELKKLGGRFVGEKDFAGVKKILANSDILVNPSYGEGMPTAVLEGGAMGLAVVATDVGGTDEIVIDGKNGFLVHPGNVRELRERIGVLLKDAKLREKFGKSLQKTVRSKFDWDKIADKFEKVLKSL